MAEETFKIEAQITALDQEESNFEELTKQANAQVLNFGQAWKKAGPREKQEIQSALFPEGFRAALGVVPLVDPEICDLGTHFLSADGGFDHAVLARSLDLSGSGN